MITIIMIFTFLKAGWVSESFSNGVTEFSHKINMYTDREVVECDVYLRKCLSNNCTAK